ncbi:MAG: hypothetical protein KC550_00005, partial [Nanoarchaeota archaeon]|nr:hypothetical protein [Nanoarchaeota archaeon]
LKIDDINSKIEYVRAKVYFLKNSNELETQNTIESIIDNLDRKILDEELKSGLKTEIQNIEFILKKLLKIKIKNNLSHPIDDELFINKILALIFLLKLKINFKFLDDCETNNNSDFVSLLKIVLDNINVNLENYSQSSISAYNGIKENYLNSLIHNLNMLADDAQNNSKIKTQFHNLLSKTYKLIISYENNFSSELKNEIIKSSGEYDIENFPNLSFLISLRKELEILSSEHLDFEHYEKNFKHLLYNLTKEVESFSKNDLSVDFDYVKSLLEELVDLVSNKKKELEKDKELNYKINTFLNETINYLKLLEIRFYLLFFKNAKESLKDKYSFYYDNLAKYYSFYAKLEINSIFEHDIMNYRFISKKLKRIISPIKADPKSPFWNSENWEENSKRINTKEHFDEINSYIEDMIYELKLIEKKQKIKIEKLL